MAPKLGDSVFIAEKNPLTDEVVVSTALVVGVPKSNPVAEFDNEDGRVVDLTVFRQDGTTSTYQSGPGESDDEGNLLPGGYVDSLDNTPGDVPEPAAPDTGTGSIAADPTVPQGSPSTGATVLLPADTPDDTLAALTAQYPGTVFAREGDDANNGGGA